MRKKLNISLVLGLCFLIIGANVVESKGDRKQKAIEPEEDDIELIEETEKENIDENDLMAILIQKQTEIGIISQNELYQNYPGDSNDLEQDDDIDAEQKYLESNVYLEKNNEELEQQYKINTLIELNAEIKDNNKEFIPELALAEKNNADQDRDYVGEILQEQEDADNVDIQEQEQQEQFMEIFGDDNDQNDFFFNDNNQQNPSGLELLDMMMRSQSLMDQVHSVRIHNIIIISLMFLAPLMIVLLVTWAFSGVLQKAAIPNGQNLVQHIDSGSDGKQVAFYI